MAHLVEAHVDWGPLTEHPPKIRSPGTRHQTVFSLLRTQTSQRSTDCTSLLPDNTNCMKNISVTQRTAQSKINHHCPDTALRENTEEKPWGTVTTDKGWWTQRYLEPIPCSVITLLCHYQGSALPQCCSHTTSSNTGLVLLYVVTSWLEFPHPTAAKTSLRAKYFLTMVTEPLRHLRSSKGSFSVSSYLPYRMKTDRQM